MQREPSVGQTLPGRPLSSIQFAESAVADGSSAPIRHLDRTPGKPPQHPIVLNAPLCCGARRSREITVRRARRV